MLPYSLKGGCMIVDSTRKGKRFPDSMSKTIPIWTCVLNRAIMNYRKRYEATENISSNWDCSLHLPLWVSKTEKASIEDRLERWTEQLEASGADIASLSSSLRKPLRVLWISQRTVIWLNEVPDYDSWDFTPIILLSASSTNSNFQHKTNSEFSWTYIAGAGDDEESWSRGLSPKLFWNNVYDLISFGPELCNQKVADIVEKDRVYRAQRGHHAPQISLRSNAYVSMEEKDVTFDIASNLNSSDENHTIFWLASTNIAVGSYKSAANGTDYDCILNCDREIINDSFENSDSHLCLPVVDSKMDRFSLSRHLQSAVNFAKLNLRERKKLLVCCSNGEDISICVSLAILASLFSDEGEFDDGKNYSKKCITKDEMRKRLVFICKYAVNARPSRGNLRQVFNFLTSEYVSPHP
ncbi:uncharacterized protein C3F10.06c isoform X2 [Impatiens glandulifera]|uniref:uncharacterized protein C3F10.06c isoform X2 n=1 Tax=Impatiens glandulifera TaxID=253017 RepID=UPI001FB139BF|nr:uncharacterized protein C3F10.06c isoform X2 [Impatiens glandulifera]